MGNYSLVPVDHDPFADQPQQPGSDPSWQNTVANWAGTTWPVRAARAVSEAARAGDRALSAAPGAIGSALYNAPGAIGHALYNAPGELLDAAKAPGDAYAGRIDPNSEEGFKRIVNLAGAVSLGPFAGEGEAGKLAMGFGGGAEKKAASAHDYQHLLNYAYNTTKDMTPAQILDSHHLWDLADMGGNANGLVSPEHFANYGNMLLKNAGHPADLTPESAHQYLLDNFHPETFEHLDHAASAPAPAVSAPHELNSPEFESALNATKNMTPDEILSSDHLWHLADQASNEGGTDAHIHFANFANMLLKNAGNDAHWTPQLAKQYMGGVQDFLEPDSTSKLNPFYQPPDPVPIFNPKGLDQSQAMQRAADMGFNTDRVLYHGRQSQPFRGTGFQSPANKSEPGIFTSPDPNVANKYASFDGVAGNYGEVMPLLARSNNPLEVDWRSIAGQDYYNGKKMNQLINDAWAKGHDYIKINNIEDLGGVQEQHVIRDPSQLRSKFAVFDPAEKDSSNLLSASGVPIFLTPVDHDPFATQPAAQSPSADTSQPPDPAAQPFPDASQQPDPAGQQPSPSQYYLAPLSPGVPAGA